MIFKSLLWFYLITGGVGGKQCFSHFLIVRDLRQQIINAIIL